MSHHCNLESFLIIINKLSVGKFYLYVTVFVSGFKEGETHGESNQRAKRSRRFYSPIDSISFLEKSVHSQSSNKVATSIHATEISSSKSTSSLKSDSQSSHKKRETTAG